MKTNSNHSRSKMPTRFAELNAIHALRPINDEIDLRNATEIMDRLAVLDQRTRDQDDYLDTLVLIIETYQKEEDTAAMEAARRVSGLEALKYLMKNTGMTQQELGELLGVGPSSVSMILSGDRPITVSHARRLGKHFSVEAGLLL